MKVLFRAEVKNVGKLSQSSFSPLIEIDKRYYAIGTESYSKLGTYWIETSDGRKFECKEETRSINLSDMIDSEGTKIFASLSEDGKGGDNLEVLDCESSKYVAVYNKTMFSYGAKNVNPAEDEWYFETFYELDGDIKVTGIQG